MQPVKFLAASVANIRATAATCSTVFGFLIDDSCANRSISASYDVTFVPRNLTITRRALTITVQDAHKTYGDTDPTPNFGITSGALLEGDRLTGAPSRGTGEMRSAVATAGGWMGLAMFQLAQLKADQPVLGAGGQMRVVV